MKIFPSTNFPINLGFLKKNALIKFELISQIYETLYNYIKILEAYEINEIYKFSIISKIKYTYI